MQSYVQTARQKKTLDELLEWAATVEGPLAAAAANAEIKRRELMAHFEIITLQREALNIQKQAAEVVREMLPLRRSELLNIPRKLPLYEMVGHCFGYCVRGQFSCWYRGIIHLPLVGCAPSLR